MRYPVDRVRMVTNELGVKRLWEGEVRCGRECWTKYICNEKVDREVESKVVHSLLGFREKCMIESMGKVCKKC